MYKTRFETDDSAADYKRLYRNVLAKVDGMAVLEHYGAKNIVRNGDELIHSCLLDKVHPHHSHGDSSPSASLNDERMLYNCWSFGGGDIVWLVQEMEGISRRRALQRLAEFIEDPYSETSKSMLQMIQERFKKNEVPVPIPVYSELILRPWRKIHPYLEDRGVSEEVIVLFKVGFDSEDDTIVLPHFWNGKLSGYQKRRLDPPWVQKWDGNIPKYKNSTDFPKNLTIFNYDRVRDRGFSEVIVVESVMSVLRAETLGIQNTVSTFGGKVSKEQIDYLKEFSRVVVWMDNDSAGWQGTTICYNGLKGFSKVMIIDGPEGKDLADFQNLTEVEDVLATRQIGSLVIKRFTDRVKGYKK